MSKHPRPRRLALLSAFAVTAATMAAVLAAPATAGTGPIRFVGHPRTVSASAAPSTGTALSDRAELAIIRDRMEQDAEFSPAGKSVAITKGLPTPTDLPPASQGTLGFGGLTHFDSRYSDGGNQFSGEPADLGMCTDGTYVLELVNNAVQLFGAGGSTVYSGTYGNAGLTGDLDPSWGLGGLSLNQFFNQPTYFDRNKYYDPEWNYDPGTFGPNLFDISCVYDADDNYWFATAAKIEVDDTTGDYTERGTNSVLIAATRTPEILASWDIWEIDTTNDGENGTPDHNCPGGPCFGDYPQLGVNEDGVFITTNEFPFFAAGYSGAQVYAINKIDLMTRESAPRFVHLENVYSDTVGDVAYTLQPANGIDRVAHTMYFGMSASPYVSTVTDKLAVFALDTTDLLAANPQPLVTKDDLVETAVTASVKYGAPQWALQKKPTSSATTPYLNFLNAGAFGVRYAKQKSPIPLDAGSGKFYGAWMDGGYLFFSTATAAKGTGGAVYSSINGGWSSIKQRAAVAIFVVDIDPSVDTHTADAKVYGVAGANLVYPSIAVRGGTGAVGATLVGPNYWPSASGLSFDVSGGGVISAPYFIWLPGQGPNDGFTGTGEGGYRTRWGDYGAAAVDTDGDLWFAVHEIAGGCSNADFAYTGPDPEDPTVPFGVCGGERSTYANWATRIFEYDVS